MAEGDFAARLLATFRVEAAEHIEAMSDSIVKLRNFPDQETIERIYREAHSLKGAARAVDMREVESMCQSLEDLLARLKKGMLEISPGLLDSMQETVDRIASQLPGKKSPLDVPPGGETVRVDLEKLKSVMRHTEELLSSKLYQQQRLNDLDEIRGILAGKKSLEPNTEMKLLEARLAAVRKASERDLRAFSAISDELFQGMREMFMMPFSSISNAFPRFVRDVSRELGKKTDLVIRGGEIGIDRRILEEIKEPLIHLLRNAVDHGIEAPEDRIAKAKAPEGRIAIALSQIDGGKVEIVVSDDGAGIDAEKVRASGKKLGLLGDGENERIEPLLFSSGVSTSQAVTGISGRGLGLAIVLEKVEKLGGGIEVETSWNSGTVFRMILPLTLATFRGVLVKAGGKRFVIPSSAIKYILRVEKKSIKMVENLETVEIEGEALSISSLAELLEMKEEAGTHLPLIVLSRAGESIGLRVEEVVGEQEVLVRTLGPQLVRVRNVSGACMLGSGEIVPVLNAPDLMKSARMKPSRPVQEKGQKHILVVEDSITSRTLLKGILESAGYKVSTAVDGIDAQLRLKNGSFDLVVSDVDMPRMDGFDLTAEIRSDRDLSSLPVVLVTSLDSREDREKGAEVGANAYIVKSSFDQSDLVEAIERLT